MSPTRYTPGVHYRHCLTCGRPIKATVSQKKGLCVRCDPASGKASSNIHGIHRVSLPLTKRTFVQYLEPWSKETTKENFMGQAQPPPQDKRLISHDPRPSFYSWRHGKAYLYLGSIEVGMPAILYLNGMGFEQTLLVKTLLDEL